MLLWRGIQGASKNPLGSLQLHLHGGTRDMAAPSFSFQWKVHWRADLKNAISRDFCHCSKFDVFFLKGEPRGIQKPKRDLPTSCGTRDMAAGSFNFIGKHVVGSASQSEQGGAPPRPPRVGSQVGSTSSPSPPGSMTRGTHLGHLRTPPQVGF